MFKFTQEEKVKFTAEYVERLVKAGWEYEQAVANSQNLYHLSEKRMKEVRNMLENNLTHS